MLILSCYFALLLAIALLLHQLHFPLAWKVNWRLRLLLISGYFLFLYGITAFLGSALLATQTLRLPLDFEWPMISANAYVTTPDGVHLVPHWPTGRVQLYDANWQFIRGWSIDAEGGVFLLLPPGPDTVEIITQRPKNQGWRYVCDLHGKVISKVSLAPLSYSSFKESPDSHSVHTYPWLWPLAHPFISCPVFFVGLLIMHLIRQTHAKTPARSRGMV